MASQKSATPLDICFVIDAAVEPGPQSQAYMDYVMDIAFQTRLADFHRHVACVLYRSPAPGNAEPEHHLKKHEVCDFGTCGDCWFEFLDGIEFCGGRQGPTDWADAFELALSSLSWRDGKKAIVWISSSNAHGTRFSTPEENDPNPDEEGRLVKLLDETASRNIIFVGINGEWDNDRPGCRKTLSEISRIYEKVRGEPCLLFDMCRYMEPDFDEVVRDFMPGRCSYGTSGSDIASALRASILGW